jgi:hypothetical protein
MRARVDAPRARAPTSSRARRGCERNRRTSPLTILAVARGKGRVDAMALDGGHAHHHHHHHQHDHGWFKSRQARDLEKWQKTHPQGRATVELAERETRGAASTKALEMAKDHVAKEAPKPDTLVHNSQPHEIDQTTRWVIATFLNRLIHVPMMNPMTEQIICVKAVDCIADAIERELHRTGAGHFFSDAVEHERRGDLEIWLNTVCDDLNLVIDVPMLDEKQEFDCIHAVMSIITHQYLEAKKRDEKDNPIKHKWILLVNMLG